jgi:hypothetical protein
MLTFPQPGDDAGLDDPENTVTFNQDSQFPYDNLGLEILQGVLEGNFEGPRNNYNYDCTYRLLLYT